MELKIKLSFSLSNAGLAKSAERVALHVPFQVLPGGLEYAPCVGIKRLAAKVGS
jgi:hypothetical protein